MTIRAGSRLGFTQDEQLVGEPLWLQSLAGQWMPGCRDHYHVVDAPGSYDDAAVLDRRLGERHVELVLLQAVHDDPRVHRAEPQLDLGMQLGERADDGRKHVRRDGGAGANVKGPLPQALEAGRGVLDGAFGEVHRSRLLVDLAALGCQADTARGTLEQRNAHLQLELPDRT